MLAKNFDHQHLEADTYRRWEESGAFQPSEHADKAYTIALPPPNVTGFLHIGHALNHTLQDILIRYRRMKGDAVLWQPGTDHAGIATQMMVERNLAEKGIQRKEIGREAFVQHVWNWKEEYGGRIVNQQRRLGESCDWSRQRFTMDDGLSTAVIKVFVSLYRQNLIYRDQRLVNWDTKFQTALSDLEVESKMVKGKLYHLRYPLEEGDGAIEVATTRPETLFGDMAVAVHPEDERYQHLIGKRVKLPLTERTIPIIADPHANPEQGSGAVKITPAHDFNDFAVGTKHGLERLSIMDSFGHLNDKVPTPFAGMERFAARKAVLEALTEQGLLLLEEEHEHAVPHGDRSKTVLEPFLTDQWYLNAEVLAKPALEAVEKNEIVIMPDSERNRYFSWMREIQPWCISRQLWWGHRIPAWYGPDGEIFVAENEKEALAEARIHYGKPERLSQDTDVLDTWFSSALWPFSTLGWPSEDNPTLEKHYPNDVLITGADILFFWVARMIMMGIHFMNEIPFHTVLLHGMVRDGQGRKMSKTVGNVVDPLELCNTHGADAVRLTLAALTVQGRDTKLSDQRLDGYRNFITKLWNASRFLEGYDIALRLDAPCPKVTATHNHWMLAELSETLVETERALQHYRFNDYTSSLYRLVWSRFCDWYIEVIKPILNDQDHPDHAETKACAEYVLCTILKLLHPVTPFVTEELFHQLSRQNTAMLIHAPWPKADNIHYNAARAEDMTRMCALITTVRSMKVSMDIAPASKCALNPKDFPPSDQAMITDYARAMYFLARITLDHADFPHQVRFPFKDDLVHLHLSGDIDLAATKARLIKEQQKVEKQFNQLNARLKNPGFIEKAPEDVLEENRERLVHLQDKRHQYKTILEAL